MHSWQKQIKNALKNKDECNAYFTTSVFEDREFSNKIPLPYAHLIDTSNPTDPLLQQVIIAPLSIDKNFTTSPLLEETHNPNAGIIHKYKNRVLLITSADCAIHCSYCFRQHFAYSQNTIFHNLDAVIDYISNDTSLNEVLLSGGDPLNLSNAKLQGLIAKIECIPHITTLRIHSRTLSVVERIDCEFIQLINATSLKVVLVTHINHPTEITPYLKKSIPRLNAVILNQSVLLKGVNDSVEILTKLSTALFDCGILPYYLNMLDTVSGSEHFHLEEKTAKLLHIGMQKKLSGYLVPKLVRDENKEYKTIL